MTAIDDPGIDLPPGQEWEQFRDALIQDQQPSGAHELMLVEQLAETALDLRQARKVARSYWEYVGGHYNRGPAGTRQMES